jgi:hypothetical protein
MSTAGLEECCRFPAMHCRHGVANMMSGTAHHNQLHVISAPLSTLQATPRPALRAVLQA